MKIRLTGLNVTVTPISDEELLTNTVGNISPSCSPEVEVEIIGEYLENYSFLHNNMHINELFYVVANLVNEDKSLRRKLQLMERG